MSNDKQVKKEPEINLRQLEQELIKKDPQIFNGVPKEKRQELIKAISITTTRIHSGPLPPFGMLQGYEEIYPGSAKIIFDVFMKQSNHRIKMEDTVVTAQQNQSSRGQIFAFIIAILFLGVAAICILKGHDWAGGILGSIDVLGIVTIFITGKRQQASNLQEKAQKLQPRKKK